MTILANGTVTQVAGIRVRFIRTGPTILPPGAPTPDEHPDCKQCLFRKALGPVCSKAPCGGGYFVRAQ